MHTSVRVKQEVLAALADLGFALKASFQEVATSISVQMKAECRGGTQ